MKNGDQTITINRLIGFVFLAFFVVSAFPSFALDNPDSPNLVSEFNARSKSYLRAINNLKNSSRKYSIAYYRYEQFLNRELDNAYQLIENKLRGRQLLQLKKSQQLWFQYRDAEFAFIADNWVRSNFGSSSVVSRGDYRCAIIRDRIIQLLDYAKNY